MKRPALAWLVLVVLAVPAGCSNARSRAVRFDLDDHAPPAVGDSERAVRDALGSATYMTGARTGVETLHFFDTRFDDCRRGCLRVELQNDRVLSVNEIATHPIMRSPDGVTPRRRVTDGSIRLGMREEAVYEALGPPHGLTAKNGVETFHYLTKIGLVRRSRTDSLIVLIDGMVVAYNERYLDGYAIDVPLSGRDSPTAGDVRVGMDAEEVEAEVGEPTRRDTTRGGRTVFVYVQGSRTPGDEADVVQYVFFDRADRVSGLLVQNLRLRREKVAVDARARRARLWRDEPDGEEADSDKKDVVGSTPDEATNDDESNGEQTGGSG